MTRIMGAILLVLLIIYAVPILVYGGASAVMELRTPGSASPSRFLLGVLVTKAGAAVAFVLIFAITADAWGPRWPLYALIWIVMFVASEAGDYVSGRGTAPEAVLGVVSELIYTPLAAFTVHWLLRR